MTHQSSNLPTTVESLRQLPPAISVEQAGAILGISRPVAYESARRFLATGEGLPVIRIGARRLVVPTLRLLKLLGVEPESTETPRLSVVE